jgi:hypothetical protein
VSTPLTSMRVADGAPQNDKASRRRQTAPYSMPRIRRGRGFGLTRALQLMPYGVEYGGPAVVPRGLRRVAWRRRRAAAGPRRLPSTSKLCGPAFARRARSRAQVAAVSRYRDRRQDEQRAGPNPLREAPSARLSAPIEGSEARHEFPGQARDVGQKRRSRSSAGPVLHGNAVGAENSSDPLAWCFVSEPDRVARVV